MVRPLAIAISLEPLALAALGCGGTPQPKPPPRNLLLVTIDTLRADHVGAYGYARARTPAIDALAAGGVRFERAYAAAPITLPSHATLLTGRYPPGHGARDNGLHVSASVPTLATELHSRGFKTAAFVAAFPLDHQFGLNRGFDVYGDQLPRQPNGQLANERPASQVVNDAIAWLRQLAPTPHPLPPFFLWVHVFEPHAPYGEPSSQRPVLERYDDEITTADREIGRLIDALGAARADTLIVAAGDHGEAFGEHGEYAHSIFVYDTTLRVPLVINGRGVAAGAKVDTPVTLADVAPTIARALGWTMADVDGVDLGPAMAGGTLDRRELYAESFAPLFEFGWAPLRGVRSGGRKYIAAPKPELYDLERDAGEEHNLVASDRATAIALAARVERYSPPQFPKTDFIDASGFDRLRALGYTMPMGSHLAPDARVDPKDRREVAAAIAQVVAGELSGDALERALEAILRSDAGNSQVHLRLGYVKLAKNDCAAAEREFTYAINGGLPGVDAYLGLATCLGRRNDVAGAARALDEARRREPDNPVVTANLGILQVNRGDLAGAIRSLSAALARDPDLHEARFNLALAYAKAGRRSEAASAAGELLRRLPATAPQRPEVERLLRAVQ
ncbi:MAG: sulfatase-like hydrolase/transferase [Acidobacteria bacterium]|nr:sulfatase-like hydrolase/transferase [Acidobacteriota bacterium]